MPLREVSIDQPIAYLRHELHQPPEPVEGTLLTLVYDIPYFGACGVFPPVHLVNQVFAGGGDDGGMGPGASWTPFRISRETYALLLGRVRATDPRTLKGRSRYLHLKLREDDSFDAIQDRLEWVRAVCEKHRERYHADLRRCEE